MGQYGHLSSDQLCALLADRDTTIKARDKIIVVQKDLIQAHEGRLAYLERGDPIPRVDALPVQMSLTGTCTNKEVLDDSKNDVKSDSEGMKEDTKNMARGTKYANIKKSTKDKESTSTRDKINVDALDGKVKPPHYSNMCRREAKGQPCRHNGCNYFHKSQQAEYSATRHELYESASKMHEQLSRSRSLDTAR